MSYSILLILKICSDLKSIAKIDAALLIDEIDLALVSATEVDAEEFNASRSNSNQDYGPDGKEENAAPLGAEFLHCRL